MNIHFRLFLVILLVGGLTIAAFKYLQPAWLNKFQSSTSDAGKTRGTITIGVDNWIGYFPLCSPLMEVQLRQSGYRLNCIDDQADYASRFKKLKRQDIQFAVATVDSYLLNGAGVNYPGVIIATIDESKGGDAIVARKDRFPNIESLKNFTRQKIAFTPGSPSEFLLKSISTHFGLPFSPQDNSWKLETEGSSEALNKLLKGQVDAAVLWEPDVTAAIASTEFIKLIGTEDTDKLIVDILLVNRNFSIDSPEAVSALLSAYFNTLKHYKEQPAELLSDMRKKTDYKDRQITDMLAGVDWITLNENGALWFDIGQTGRNQGLKNSINIAVDILNKSGDFDTNPLPGGDEYSIINSQYISALYHKSYSGLSTGNPNRGRHFKLLDDAEWASLKVVGNLQLEPISFRRGTGILNNDGRMSIERTISQLQRYPNFRIRISGHTGLSGDAQANLALSVSRAKTVAQTILDDPSFDANRIRAVGYGSSRPLKKLAGESSRTYKYRLSRVEIALLTE